MLVTAFLRSACAVVAAGASMLSHATIATSQGADAAFFKDKTVKLVVGYGPGGGYDAYARMIAPHLSRVLGASVIVENLPGAGGIAALNRTAVSPPDGLTIQIVNGTAAALSQLIEVSSVRYNILELTHLGTVSASPWMWMVGPNSPLKHPRDALKPDLRLSWAGGGPIDGLSDGAAVACEALKLNCRIVIGYKGSNDAALAVLRGEMDAIYVSDTSANNIAKSGGAHALAAMGRKRSRFFPSTPTIFEALNVSKDAEWLFDFRTAVDDLGRILVGPPKMDASRAAVLREAIRQTLSDKAVIEEGERTQRYVGYVGGNETLVNVKKVLGDPSPDQRARLKAIFAKAQ